MDWHRRYLQQANWTHDLRTYLFKKANLNDKSHVLEVGCGTGAILSELLHPTALHGLDIDATALAQCRVNAPTASLVQGDALQLSYPSENFDIVYCHFLLLWVHDPLQALLEMKRVANSGGHIMAFAEPDYTARIDEPRELIPLGRWQMESLKRQGADPGVGARLADLFSRAGIEIVETGIIQNAENAPSAEEWEIEWTVLESDLALSMPNDELQKMKRLDQQAWKRGERKLSIPTYFAWGHA
jgi:SAM-dependent methyltransferase